MEEYKEQLDRIESKLDQILENQAWDKKQWKKAQSFETRASQWGGFYIASLLADETLGLNGSNGLFRNNNNVK